MTSALDAKVVKVRHEATAAELGKKLGSVEHSFPVRVAQKFVEAITKSWKKKAVKKEAEIKELKQELTDSMSKTPKHGFDPDEIVTKKDNNKLQAKINRMEIRQARRLQRINVYSNYKTNGLRTKRDVFFFMLPKMLLDSFGGLIHNVGDVIQTIGGMNKYGSVTQPVDLNNTASSKKYTPKEVADSVPILGKTNSQPDPLKSNAKLGNSDDKFYNYRYDSSAGLSSQPVKQEPKNQPDYNTYINTRNEIEAEENKGAPKTQQPNQTPVVTGAEGKLTLIENLSNTNKEQAKKIKEQEEAIVTLTTQSKAATEEAKRILKEAEEAAERNKEMLNQISAKEKELNEKYESLMAMVKRVSAYTGITEEEILDSNSKENGGKQIG